MSMSDPIADLLTRIRNAQMVAKPTVSVPASKVKMAELVLELRIFLILPLITRVQPEFLRITEYL